MRNTVGSYLFSFLLVCFAYKDICVCVCVLTCMWLHMCVDAYVHAWVLGMRTLTLTLT